MLPPPLVVTPAHARRFMLRVLGLEAPFPDVATALSHHGLLLYCLRKDMSLLYEAAEATPNGRHPAAPLLLAPLDPVIYDRTVTRRVWDFDYTWEVYTPPARRVRGYYALPVLAGEAIAGHVDPKADRETGRLRVVSRRVKRGVSTAGAVRELAQFLGLR